MAQECVRHAILQPRLCYDPVKNSLIWLAVHDARKILIALEFKGRWPICLVCAFGLGSIT